jgi:hypothetical protein
MPGNSPQSEPVKSPRLAATKLSLLHFSPHLANVAWCAGCRVHHSFAPLGSADLALNANGSEASRLSDARRTSTFHASRPNLMAAVGWADTDGPDSVVPGNVNDSTSRRVEGKIGGSAPSR